MSSSWDKYLNGYLLNKQLPDKKWLQNIVEHAAIVSHAGVIYSSTKGFTLGTYEIEVETEKGGKKKEMIDEKAILAQIVLKGTPIGLASGVRINNEKHMLVRYDPGKMLAYFAKRDGGACAMATKTTIIYASYDKNKTLSDGNTQNPGVCNEVVEKLGDILYKSGA